MRVTCQAGYAIAGGFNWLAFGYALWESFVVVGVCIGLLVLFRQRWNHQGKLAEESARSSWKHIEREANRLVVTAENDQSAVSGDLQLWESFFEQARAVECPVRMTFDLGNELVPIGDHQGPAIHIPAILAPTGFEGAFPGVMPPGEACGRRRSLFTP